MGNIFYKSCCNIEQNNEKETEINNENVQKIKEYPNKNNNNDNSNIYNTLISMNINEKSNYNTESNAYLKGKKNSYKINNNNNDINSNISQNINNYSKINTESNIYIKEKYSYKINNNNNDINSNISQILNNQSNYNPFTNNNTILTENNYDFIECNFIYFDENISNSENYNYFLEFKKRAKGIFFPCDSYKIFEKIILKLEIDSFHFILVCSGKVAEKYFKEQYKQFYNIIIFCYDVNKYKKLFFNRNEIQIYNEFNLVLKALKEFNFNIISQPINFPIYNKNYNFYMDLNLKDKYKPTKFITFDDFQNNDKIYLKLLLKNYPSDYYNLPYFSKDSEENLINCINSNDKIEKKIFLIERIENIKKSNDISKNIIETYIAETGIVYLVNRYLRECESNNYKLISGYISTLIYSIEYLFNKNELYGVYYDITLYRGIMLKISDICLYKISTGKLICFPGFTSTSTRKEAIKNFPTDLGKKINELDNQYCVIMVFNYNYKNGNKSPVFNLSKINPSEAEFLFPPFSFFKILKVEMKEGTPDDPIYIYLEVPNISFDFYLKFKNGFDIKYEKVNNTLVIE